MYTRYNCGLYIQRVKRFRGVHVKINIYYGGRGIIGDPTLGVLEKMQEVLTELNVQVERYDLYEYKHNVLTLPQTLKDTDGVILATTVEWYGIGGSMQQFLDACWLYGDKEKLKHIYMCPVVMSTTNGEREALMNLTVAWEILGGIPCTGLSGYITEVSELEVNPGYMRLIEKRTEDLYRAISQKAAVLPCSNQVVKQKVSHTQSLNLTPQEAEQLSELAADDLYVQKQKQDILELTSMFKNLLGDELAGGSDEDRLIEVFQKHFTVQPGFQGVYKFRFIDNGKVFVLSIDHTTLRCYFGDTENANIELQITKDMMNEITQGRMSFQRAFMSGSIKIKGDFRILRTLDLLFDFTTTVS